MKRIHKHLSYLLPTITAGMGLMSCMSEEPFSNDSEGTALVKMNLSLNSTVTRAIGAEESSGLYNNCVVYISNGEGLLHKWQGLNQIPSNGVYLKFGDYLAEAWAGDSVPASFDKRFFKGETPFKVSSSQISTQVTVNCKLGNVVASVDPTGLPDYVQNSLKVDIALGDANLEYSGETLMYRGYYMRPFDKETGSYLNSLTYTVKGTDFDGTEFVKEGTIPNIVPAHEYRLVLDQVKEEAGNAGGAFIQLEVKEYELLIDDEFDIYGKPEFSWKDNEIDLDGQIYNDQNDFSSYTLMIGGYRDFQSIYLTTENPVLQEALGLNGRNAIDIVGATPSAIESLKSKGIEISNGYNNKLCIYEIKLGSTWLNELQNSTEAYLINVEAVDNRGMSNKMTINIANNESAMAAPFSLDVSQWTKDLLAVRAYSANVEANVVVGPVENLGIQYRKKDSGEWDGYLALDSQTVKGKVAGKLTGLDSDTDYECRIVGGAQVNGVYKFTSNIGNFHTEEEFDIPNASMEQWYKGSVIEPGENGQPKFWDTGNQGTNMAGFIATQGSTDFHHNGTTSAKLHTQSGLLNKLGAGNLFIGEFGKVSGLNGAQVHFGKNYNGTHPTQLKFYARYRPVAITHYDSSTPDPEVSKGVTDRGQVYIALATSVFSVDTNVKQYFNPDDERILAYGEITWSDNFGPEDGMQEQYVELKYKDKAKTTEATHLIIVASASKYGDYFTGGDGSILYLDDFELVYE